MSIPFTLRLQLIEDGDLEKATIKIINHLMNEAMYVYNSKKEEDRTLNDHLNKMIADMIKDEEKMHNVAKNIVIRTIEDIEGILAYEFATYANYLKEESSSMIDEKYETGKSLEEILEERKGSL